MITDAVGCDSARRALSAGNVINALVYVVICLFRQPKTFNRICFLSIICVCLFNQTESKEQQVITFLWLTYGHACGETPQAMPKLNFISWFWKLIFFVFFYYFFKFYSAFNFFCKLVINFYFFHVFAKFVGWNGPGVPDIGHFSHSEQVHLLIMSYYSF